jgi:hypothetical protein
MGVPERVRVWEDREGRWWWAFVGGDIEIPSNQPFATRRETEEAARTAYPGVALASERTTEPASEGRAGLVACVLMTLALWRHYRPRGR